MRYIDEKDVRIREHQELGCDVLIADYDLGELSGVELAERLSDDLGSVPVILISGTSRSSDCDGGWPPCVAGFALKSDGVAHILGLAEAAWRRAEASA
jgi:DNA-binding NarL/FixJ family response regulator